MSSWKKKYSNRQMNLKTLRKICSSKGGYDTPELNDCLYLNFEGFTKIENLEPFFNIKSLFLEGNCIAKIENLEKLKELRALCINNNMLSRIENLQCCVNLRTLNLSSNHIKKIEGISCLKFLDTLNVRSNIIHTLQDVEQVLECPSITTLELSNNRIDDSKIIDMLAGMPNLRSLYLKGNPFLNKMDFYRKHAVGQIETLTFLDDRPIFENERRLNNAWIKGGRQGEENEKKLMEMEKHQQKVKKMESRRLAQQRYQARVRAMQQRLMQATIHENQEYKNNDDETSISIGQSNNSQEMKQDDESDDTESWTMGSVDCTSEDMESFSMISTDLDVPNPSSIASISRSPSKFSETASQTMDNSEDCSESITLINSVNTDMHDDKQKEPQASKSNAQSQMFELD